VLESAKYAEMMIGRLYRRRDIIEFVDAKVAEI
jgi:hypothetical protein